jgi:hypothetical protein
VGFAFIIETLVGTVSSERRDGPMSKRFHGRNDGLEPSYRKECGLVARLTHPVKNEPALQGAIRDAPSHSDQMPPAISLRIIAR